jgi:hypothetical protein
MLSSAVARKKGVLESKGAHAATTKHTWFGQICHLIRKDGSTVRCLVQDFVVLPHHTGLKCSFYSSRTGKVLHKICSPLYLVMVEMRWNAVEVVSDDESSSVDPDVLAKAFGVVDGIQQTDRVGILQGPFKITDNDFLQSLSGEPAAVVEWATREVNLARGFSTLS